MGLKDKVKQELELRNMYKEHVEKLGINADDSYEVFKEKTLKDRERVKDNNEIVPLILGFITKVVEQNENLDTYLQPLQSFIDETINGANSHTKCYAVSKENNEGNETYKFTCKSGYDTLWPILTVDIKIGKDNNIASLSAKHLTTLNFEGAKHLTPTSSIDIVDIDKEQAEVTTATYPTDFFCKSFNKTENEYEWDNLVVDTVSKSKNKTK